MKEGREGRREKGGREGRKEEKKEERKGKGKCTTTNWIMLMKLINNILNQLEVFSVSC